MDGSLNYNYKIVRQFAIATVFWGVIGMAVGVWIAAQLAWPALIYVGALWLITFPVSMILLARAFVGRGDATLEIHSRNLDARVHFTEV